MMLRNSPASNLGIGAVAMISATGGAYFLVGLPGVFLVVGILIFIDISIWSSVSALAKKEIE